MRSISSGATALTFAAVLLLPISPAFAETWSEVSTGNESCNKALMLSESAGFIQAGTKLRQTSDGGATWSDLGSLGNFWGISTFHFFDAQNGLAFASNPTKSQTKAWVWHTTDGGQSWTQGNEIPLSVSRVGFFSATEGYAFGGKKDITTCPGSTTKCNFIYWTADGGKTWTEDTNQDKYGGDSVVMLSKLVGYKTGSGGIFRTGDGAANWTFQHKPTTGVPHTPVFFNDQVGFVMNTQRFEMIYTADGGTTWNTVTLGANGNRYDKVAFKSATEAFALVTSNTNKRSIWRTTNGGASWTQDTIPSAYELNNVWGCAAWKGGLQFAFSNFKMLRVGTASGNADSGTTAADSGTTTADSGTTTADAGVAADSGGSRNDSGGSTAKDGGSSSGDSGTTAGGGGDDGGCAVALGDGSLGGVALLLLGALILARRRRQRTR